MQQGIEDKSVAPEEGAVPDTAAEVINATGLDTSDVPGEMDEFIHISEVMQHNFASAMERSQGILHKTNLGAKSLWKAYIESFPEEKRQEYNCRCCKKFLKEVGDLVYIDKDLGEPVSALWRGLVPGGFEEQFLAMRSAVEDSVADGYFTVYVPVDHAGFGKYKAGGFNHFNLRPEDVVELPVARTSERAKRQEFSLLKRTLEFFGNEVPPKALTYMTASNSKGELGKWISPLAIYCNVLKEVNSTKNELFKNNFIWRAVATHNPDVTNIKNTVVGAFMLDILRRDDIENAMMEFRKRTDTTKYFHPTAPVNAGTVAAAEKVFQDLDIASALDRRHAKLSEIPTFLWKPKTQKEVAARGGLFGHLLDGNGNAKTEVMGTVLTWSRFEQEFLKTADKVEIKFSGTRSYVFGSFTTAVDPEAKPIFRYDSMEKRNQFGDFVRLTKDENTGRVEGMPSAVYGLTPQKWYELEGITVQAAEFTTDVQSGIRKLIIKDGKFPVSPGAALFAEVMIPELFSVRSVVEQYSNNAMLANPEDAIVFLHLGGVAAAVEVNLRVTTGDMVVTYYVDREY